MVVDDSYSLLSEEDLDQSHGLLLNADQRFDKYRHSHLSSTNKNLRASQPGYADKSLDKFFTRFEPDWEQDRLQFSSAQYPDTATLEGTTRRESDRLRRQEIECHCHLDLSGVLRGAEHHRH